MKKAKISVRIDEEIKTKAEKIFKDLGMSNSEAIRLFFNQTVINNGLPFKLKTNRTGIWEIRSRVDWLNNETNEKYITNKVILRGKTLTDNPLYGKEREIYFIIDNAEKISIQFDKYFANYKMYSFGYKYMIQDKKGNKFELKLINSMQFDRITFDETSSKAIHNVFRKGGKVRIVIYNEYNEPITQTKYISDGYEFTIKNANSYENIYRKFRLDY